MRTTINTTAQPNYGGSAIEVRNLRKTYPGGVEAVKDVSFDVAAGAVFGLLGPNGAGKSITIGVLTTTVRPTSGTASVAGCDVATQPLWARAVSSVVFQDQVLDPDADRAAQHRAPAASVGHAAHDDGSRA